jgi:hypothetical protein
MGEGKSMRAQYGVGCCGIDGWEDACAQLRYMV